MVEQRPTHRQALWRAFKFSALMVGGATVVAFPLFYWLIFSYLADDPTFTPAMLDSAWFRAKFTLVASPFFLIPVLTLHGWITNRTEPTRAEVEAREREQALALLKRYPDLVPVAQQSGHHHGPGIKA